MDKKQSGVYALILSAGFSSRMAPLFKPLLPLSYPQGSETTLRHLCELYKKEGIRPIVVTGHRTEDTEQEAKYCGALTAFNPHPEDGMFSSVCAGVKALPEECRRFFVHPVDIPLVRPLTIRALCSTKDSSTDRILLPSFCGKHGHPAYFPADLKEEILSDSGERGLKKIVENHEVISVPVPDSFILRDMDTPDEYEEMKRYASYYDALLPNEAEELIRIRNIPIKGIAHGRAVGNLARAFAMILQKVNPQNYEHILDESIIYSGGLLHDICKGVPHHEAAAGDYFRSLSLDQLALLVESHMDMIFPENFPFTGKELVYLADKYVHGSRFIPLENRFAQKLELYKEDPEVCSAILERLDHAKDMAKRFKAVTGQEAEEIAKNIVR